jgi:ATP-binding cassette subfamily B protein
MMSKSGFTDLALMRRVLNQAKGFWRYSTVLFLIDLLATPLGLLAPLPLKIAVDSVIGTAPLPEIVAPIVPNSVTASNSRLLVFVVILQILAVLFIQLQSLLSYSLRTKVGEGMTLNFRARLFHQAQRLSLVFHDTR